MNSILILVALNWFAVDIHQIQKKEPLFLVFDDNSGEKSNLKLEHSTSTILQFEIYKTDANEPTEVFHYKIGDRVDTLTRAAFNKLNTLTVEEARELELSVLKKRIGEDSSKNSIRVASSPNDVFKDIFILEKLTDGRYVKIKVWWVEKTH